MQGGIRRDGKGTKKIGGACEAEKRKRDSRSTKKKGRRDRRREDEGERGNGVSKRNPDYVLSQRSQPFTQTCDILSEYHHLIHYVVHMCQAVN